MGEHPLRGRARAQRRRCGRRIVGKGFLAFREALAWSQSTRAAPAGGLGDHLDYAFDRVVAADKSGYADHICEIICDLLEEEKK